MGVEYSYKSFHKVVFRTPFFPFASYKKHLEKLDKEEDYWTVFLKDPILQEALFLATPILFEEVLKFLEGTLQKPKEVQKLKMAVLKYFSRMSTRCTPFGLFAGFSMAEIGSHSEIELLDPTFYKRHTRLDMNYLCNLVQDIEKKENIQPHLRYYPNTSIYRIGGRYRYVEYYYKDARRRHQISAVDHSSYLEAILQRAQQGASPNELAELLTEEGIGVDDSLEFIQDLIVNQLLVSEIEPSVTGKDGLAQLKAQLKQIPKSRKIGTQLSGISKILKKIDQEKIGTTLPLYKEIEEKIKELETPYELKFLFQTDMYKPAKKAVLDSYWIDQIWEALRLMNKITFPPTETFLSKFVENFYDRYEEREMPLLQVLDSENGIGYRVFSGDINPLLNGYVLPEQSTPSTEIKWDSVQKVLHEKYMKAHRDRVLMIEITDKDFDFLKEDWNNMPPTISSMCQFFSVNKAHPLVYVHGSGGSSSANLFGRFCHVEKKLENYVHEITEFEQSSSDAILAEVVHLPESRVGNVLLRPIIRSYEIPYLCRSSVEREFQISASDLYISIRGNKVKLRSKRLNKEIIPRLSTAHNYSANSMPVYHFLCDLQTQGFRNYIGFKWGTFFNEYDFLPRVKYKNTILALAKWVVKTDDFKVFIEGKETEDLKKNISTWRKERQIPRYMVFPDGDNELFVDLENNISIRALYSIIKKSNSFILEEFPFDPLHALVKDASGNAYTNEFILGFYKEEHSSSEESGSHN